MDIFFQIGLLGSGLIIKQGSYYSYIAIAVELKNSYSMILVNHDKCKNLNLKPARDLYDWLKSD